VVTVLAGFIAWRNIQHDIVWTVGGTVEILLIPFLVAYLRKKEQRNWDAFAYFWLALGLLIPYPLSSSGSLDGAAWSARCLDLADTYPYPFFTAQPDEFTESEIIRLDVRTIQTVAEEAACRSGICYLQRPMSNTRSH
jgi:hypothetical protein